MGRRLLLSGMMALALLVMPTSALAQEDRSVEQALAARILQLTLPDLEKQILAFAQQVTEQVGLEDLDPQAARWFDKNAGPILLKHLRVFITEVEVLYADTLTREELQAMIEFYQTPLGSSIARKQVQLGLEMSEPTTRMEAAFVTELLESYCRDNGCDDGAGANKSSRR